MTSQETDLTIRKEVLLRWPVEEAFATFTERISTWWPLRTHSLGEERAQACVFESRAGGRIYEIWDDGTERDWGEVTVWEPPHRVVYRWKPNPDAPAATEVEVRFSPEGGGTRLELEHRGWERYGERAAEAYGNYDGGWDIVLAAYEAAPVAR